MSIIGKNIKKLRQEKGISQDKLSKLADISLNTVVKIELDQSPNPTLETIQKLAKALDVSLNDLISLVPESNATLLARSAKDVKLDSYE
jgi:transcriptional regulator with XRE-family HTH domain